MREPKQLQEHNLRRKCAQDAQRNPNRFLHLQNSARKKFALNPNRFYHLQQETRTPHPLGLFSLAREQNPRADGPSKARQRKLGGPSFLLRRVGYHKGQPKGSVRIETLAEK